MGPVLAMRAAQEPPAAAQVVAAQAGTTVDAPSAPAARSSTPVPRAAPDDVLLEPMARPRLAFDYTHLGPEGAAWFSAIVADELSRQVPALRRHLIP